MHATGKQIIYSLLLSAFGVVSTSTGPLIFPAYTDYIPCTDTAANCAKQYYGIQKSNQASLDVTLGQASSAQTDAGNLLNAVTSLKNTAASLTDAMDPDNTRTNGGEIRVVNGVKSLVGVTPYMATLSQRLVNAVTTRGADLKKSVSNLKTGMDQVTRLLTDAQKTANSQMVTTSTLLQQAITDQSVQLQNFFQQLDSRLVASASQFDSANGASPNSTAMSLASVLRLEATDFNTTSARLTDIYNQVAALPADLDSYLQSLIAQLTTYQAGQETYANQLNANTSIAFNAELTDMSARLAAKLAGILATSRSDPYYNSSLPGYIAVQRRPLDAQILATNRTQQARLNTMIDTVNGLSKTVNTAFQPILSDVSTLVAQVGVTDGQFQAAVNSAINDANATVTASNTSFTNFVKDMETVWNTTGGILSGQTTTITAAMLNQISNMTHDAGAEVDKLNTLMYEAGRGALESDAVRQAILDNSRSQVISMLGSNDAAVNASFATIRDFMNKSSAEINLILSIVQAISGDKLTGLNATATAGITNVYRQINNTRNGTAKIISDLLAGVANDTQADFAAMQLAYNGMQSSGSINADQIVQLLAAMQASNMGMFNSTNAQIADARNLVRQAAQVSTDLANSVGNIPTVSSARRTNETNRLNAIIASASVNLTTTQNAIQNQFDAVKQTIQQAVANMGSNQTFMIQAMANQLNTASSGYGSQSAALVAQFNGLVSTVNANVSVSASALTDLASQLTALSTSLANSYQSALTRVTAAVSAATASATADVDSYTAGMKTNVTAEVTAGVRNATNNIASRVSALTSQMTQVEGRVDALVASVNALRNRPQNLVDKAQQLQTQFRTQLLALRSRILELASDNESRSRDFQSKVNTTFGSGDIDEIGHPGVQALIGRLRHLLNGIERGVNLTINSRLTSIGSTINTTLDAARVKVTQTQATIGQHHAQLDTDVTQIMDGAMRYMNASFGGFQQLIQNLNSSIYDKLAASASLSDQLASLQDQVVQVSGQVSNSSATESTAAMIADFGESMAAQMEALMNSSQTQLTAAQKEQVRLQLMSANYALDGAGSLGSSGAALADSVQAAIDRVAAQAATVQANTAAVKQRLDAVSASAQRTVNLTASDIAAIVAKYRDDSNATKAAVDAQLAAAGKASASVQDAMVIWTNLKAAASKLADDEMQNLSATRGDVFKFTDSTIDQTKKRAQADVAALQGRMNAIDSNVSIAHQSNMGILDSLISQLDGLTASAEAQKSGYESQVASLRSYVSTLVSKLSARYDSIMAQAPAFRTMIEGIAAADIKTISRLTSV